jgi:endonuclease-3 related protein
MEVVVGAILTQNTAWANVERAIRNLRREKLLSVERLAAVDEARLAELIRPSGYFNQKARRIRVFIELLRARFGGRISRLCALPLPELRETLLAVNGIGPETADSIILYAAKKPVFVVDAYTRRFMVRHGWATKNESYDELAARFTRQLEPDTALYNEYHALIVQLGKSCCRPREPKCDECPLRNWL